MSSGRRRKPLKTGTIIKLVIGLAVLAAVIFFGVNALRKKVDAKMNNGDENTVESAQVTTGSISTTVSGSGTLSYGEEDELTLPSDVEIEKYYVSAGDNVEKGDLLASVNTTSLVTAMSKIQEEIDTLDKKLAEAEDETVADEITASVSGRVKKIYAAEGDDVASVMYTYDAVILLSLDGLMSVEVETDQLTDGESVDVVTDGETYTGTVEKVVSGKATITLTDNGPVFGNEAAVSKAGTELGTGTLAIHRSLAVTGYAGTVSTIKVSENQKVSSGSTLLTLTDTSYTANYDSLLAEREELEDKLADLVTVYKEGAVYARESGKLVTLTKGSPAATSTSTNTGFGGNGGTTTTTTSGTDTVFTISPSTSMNVTVSIDESDILALSVGQEATVSIDSLEDQTFTGTVTEVGTSGSSSGGVTSYSAVINIEGNSSMLSGMSASASIMIEGTDNALLIPVGALQKTSTTAYVYTSCNEETGELGDLTEVTIGISNNNYVEIKSGLSEGTTVYYKENTDNNSIFGNMPSGMDFGNGGGMSMPSGMDFGNGGGNMPSGGGMSMPGGMSRPGGN